METCQAGLEWTCVRTTEAYSRCVVVVYEGLSSCNIQRIQAKHLTSGTNYKKRQLYLAYYSFYKVSRTKIHHITYHKSQGCGLESLCVYSVVRTHDVAFYAPLEKAA